MRAAALALLAAGCNQIFGIAKTQPWDAALPLDAADWPSSITWQVLAAEQVTLDPIDELAVQVASLDTGTGSATYEVPLTPVAVDAAGGFRIPYELGLEPYRVAFTAPDGIPTEIQSKLAGFHYAFPLYGRRDREAVPPGATASGTAAGETGAYANERLLTAGLWSVTEAAATPSGAFAFPYQASGVSLSGALGIPRAADGDVAVVLFMTDEAADAGYAVIAADGFDAPLSAPWQTAAAQSIYWSGAMIANAPQRLSNAQGALGGGATSTSDRWAGVVPGAMLPAFAQPMTAATATTTGAPPPVLLPLAENGSSKLSFENPFTGGTGQAPLLPTAIYAGDFRTRTVLDATATPPTPLVQLTTGIQSVMLADPNTATSAAAPTYAVGIAQATQAMPIAFGGIALDAEQAVVPTDGAAMLPLQFSADAGVDDCIVTLFRVEAMTVTPIARYIVADTPASSQFPIMVDAKYLDPTSLFTFGIRCELGHASKSDFTQVTYPFSSSLTFTATFYAPVSGS